MTGINPGDDKLHRMMAKGWGILPLNDFCMKKILLIEDQPATGDNTKELLRLSNFMVLSADNTGDGVRIIKTQNPDLIICDLALPGQDIAGVIQALHQEPASLYIPIIVLTA